MGDAKDLCTPVARRWDSILYSVRWGRTICVLRGGEGQRREEG